MARAAALHVAGSPGTMYNPLFIYGGVGLGKTHLVHAVGNKLLADRPNAKVLYIHAEQFVTDVVKAYQRKTFDEFKERYGATLVTGDLPVAEYTALQMKQAVAGYGRIS